MPGKEKLVDKLDRQDYIKFIESLILNSDSYKRNNDSKSYVMALDSAWGTGKSYFIDLLVQDINEQGNIFVVKYNAWANDYCDNAFNPLIYDVLNAECLKFSTKTVADIESAKKFLKNVFDIGKSFAKKTAVNFFESQTGINIEEILDKVKENIDIKEFLHGELPGLSELNKQRAAFVSLKKYLSNSIQWMKEKDSKFVIIIDELDRCKPSFAIQTLEIVKHIFDIENVVFLFSVDIEQLSHSISSVYGQGFDSVGYLCRFFDYIAKLPNPTMDTFISYKFDEIGLNRQHPDIIKLHEYVCMLVEHFNLSLRDLDTVLQSYKILNDTKLTKYHIFDAHFVYLFYLTLKYKNPDLYYKIFIDKSLSNSAVRELYKNPIFDLDNLCKSAFLNSSIQDLWNNDKLYTRNMTLYRLETAMYSNLKIEAITEGQIRLKHDTLRISIDGSTNLGKLLFYPDLVKWEEICTFTYKEYIHKQLENYNFIDTTENQGIND